MTNIIKYQQFSEVEMMVGQIVEAIDVETSEKLIRMLVDFGEDKMRVVFSGIRPNYNAVDLRGKKTVFVSNVEPRTIMGEKSEAMILGGGEKETGLSILLLDKDLPVGTKVY